MKNWLMLLVPAGLLAVYVICFTDWFRSQNLSIFHVSRKVPARMAAANGPVNLIFGLNRKFNLTEVEVVPLQAYQTNKHVLPLWHLVSDSNSVPIKSFIYGQFIRGLKPAVPGTRPQRLTNNVTYRLLITAGKIKGEHDFQGP